jgi:fructokinase
MSNLQFGIDLGGTKTEIIVLDAHGQRRFGARVATPADSYRAILQTIAALLAQAEQALSAKAHHLGVGAPGTPFGAEGRLKNANTTCLIGQPLATDLQTMLHIPVTVENDANCLVLSEATDGAGADAAVVFGVILGTGVGGALAINRQLVNGPNRITGEWGHNPLPRWSDPIRPVLASRACYCGLTDCIETYLCGKGLCQTYKDLAPDAAPIDTASLIATAADQGDPRAQRALVHYHDMLSQCLATVINVLDPDVIVFGGGLSQLPGLCTAVHQRLPAHVFGADLQTRFAVAQHGDASGVRGAAWLGSNPD